MHIPGFLSVVFTSAVTPSWTTSHSCCPVLLDLLLASRAVNQFWRQERKVRLRVRGEGTERWVCNPSAPDL